MRRRSAGRLLDVMPIGPGTRFLDLGCGPGTACRQAAAKGAEATGVDVDEEVLEAARILGGARFLRASLHDVPIGDGSVDFVWCHDRIYRERDPDAVIAEAHRVLAPGGWLHATLAYYEENPASHRWPRIEQVPMVLRPTAAWVAAFEEAGFAAVERERLRTDRRTRLPWERVAGVLHVWGMKPR